VVDLPGGRAGAYVDAAITRQLAYLRQAGEGERNHALYVSSVALGQLAAGGALTAEQAADLLEAAALSIGLTRFETLRHHPVRARCWRAAAPGGGRVSGVPADRPGLHVVGPDDAADVLSAAPKQPARIRTSWTAADIMAMEFAPPKWAVPGVLSEGVNLLCGPPKVGKSWMSLGLGLDVAMGGKAFGAIEVDAGPVLYLALEDTARRLQNRLRKVLAGRSAPAGLTLATECPPLPQGGDQAIAAWLDRNRDARMVIIDVFAKLRGNSAPGASAYDADYAAVGRAKRVADDYGVAFVLVHHVRKAGSDDFLTEVSGTNGLAGAADATLVLKRARNQGDGVLHVTGRDVDEAEYALTFNPDNGRVDRCSTARPRTTRSARPARRSCGGCGQRRAAHRRPSPKAPGLSRTPCGRRARGCSPMVSSPLNRAAGTGCRVSPLSLLSLVSPNLR
jgi:hypothetical protein